MANKVDHIEVITEIWDEHRIKSSSGRDYVHDGTLNMSFGCKYNLLDKEYQSYFLSHMNQPDYIMFEQQMSAQYEGMYPKTIDWDLTGFYGRAGGQYVVSFGVDGPLRDLTVDGIIDPDTYELNELIQAFHTIIEYEYITNRIRNFMIGYFNDEVEDLQIECYEEEYDRFMDKQKTIAVQEEIAKFREFKYQKEIIANYILFDN